MTDLSRSDQLAETMAMMQIAREQGWGKVTIEITRGGTYRVQVEADGVTVARPMTSTGRERRARTIQKPTAAGNGGGPDNALSPLAARVAVGTVNAGEV